MSKWEYCEVEVTIGGFLTGVQGEVVFFRPDGKHVKKKEEYGPCLLNLAKRAGN